MKKGSNSKRDGGVPAWAPSSYSFHMKLTNKVLVGQEMPRHIQVAYGRHIFALAHRGRNCGLWLRDLPTSMFDLWREYGFREPLLEYYRECKRTGDSPQF